MSLKSFDLIFTNPPFGSKLSVDDPEILRRYDISFKWEKSSGWRFIKTNDLRSSVPPEELFIERCLQFSKPSGKVAIVMPDSILTNPSSAYVRYWILSKAKVLASIDLPPETFQPMVGTKTSLLILERKSDDEEGVEKTEYEVFMAIAKKIGHDKRGMPIYRRTLDGKEIIVEVDRMVTKIIEGRKVREKIKVKEKIIDNDLPPYLRDLRGGGMSEEIEVFQFHSEKLYRARLVLMHPITLVKFLSLLHPVKQLIRS